jgi:hypothetical protein
MKLVRGMTCALALAAMLPTARAQQGITPFVQILGFASIPIESCNDPGATLNVLANGTVAHSDTYAIFVNGALHYRWAEGEDMSWVSERALPYGLNSNAGSGSFVANSTITGQIVTFSRSNPSGPIFTAGEPVFSSQISWNCTTGEQVGPILNLDLRPQRVPLPTPWWLLAALLAMAALCGQARLQRGD